jgi:hypothetical protein
MTMWALRTRTQPGKTRNPQAVIEEPTMRTAASAYPARAIQRRR